MSGRVEERSARVARIDRRVRLDHVPDGDAARALDLAAEGADHARRQRVIETVRVADRDRLLTDLELSGLGDLDRDEHFRRSLHLQHRDVFAWLEPDDLGLELLLVVERDRHGAGAVDDMVVRDDVAGVVPDEAGARAGGHLLRDTGEVVDHHALLRDEHRRGRAGLEDVDRVSLVLDASRRRERRHGRRRRAGLTGRRRRVRSRLRLLAAGKEWESDGDEKEASAESATHGSAAL